MGAGLSGIGAAHHLQTQCPSKSYAILEGRSRLGGTWDLFRYPGVRSDSDMYTLGYNFRPWKDAKSIADGPAILQYVKDAAKEGAIERHIRFEHTAISADWSDAARQWTVVSRCKGETVHVTCRFLFMCAGYYSYDSGYTPDFAGLSDFNGSVVHPQNWPADTVHANKQVVVIGSGATAITLVPELAKTAKQVTMLQRSPTYVIARPSRDKVALLLQKLLPQGLAYGLARWKQVLIGSLLFNWCRNRPAAAKRLLLAGVRKALGPDFDVHKHFTPRYNPWEQRLCLVPDGDFFKAISSGRASVVTDEVDCFVPDGIRLKSGEHLKADLIVTATGLNLKAMGGLQISINGCLVDMSQTLNYKGVMYSGIPNFAASFGYTNASWTLKSDLTCQYVCRVLNHMQQHGHSHCTPLNTDTTVVAEPWIDFSSGYFQRAVHLFPKQGSKAPWRLFQNYRKDIATLRRGRLDDGILRFSPPTEAV